MVSPGQWQSSSEKVHGLSTLQVNTPTIKLNDILQQGGSLRAEAQPTINAEADQAIQNFIAQLDEQQAQQIYNMFSDIVEESAG